MPRVLSDTRLREIDTFLARDTTLSPATTYRWRQRLAEVDELLVAQARERERLPLAPFPDVDETAPRRRAR